MSRIRLIAGLAALVTVVTVVVLYGLATGNSAREDRLVAEARTGVIPGIGINGDTATIPEKAVPRSLSMFQATGSDLSLVMHADSPREE